MISINQTKLKKENTKKLTTIEISYIDLIERLGVPNFKETNNNKTKVEWRLLISDNQMYEEEDLILIKPLNEQEEIQYVTKWEIRGSYGLLAYELKTLILEKEPLNIKVTA